MNTNQSPLKLSVFMFLQFKFEGAQIGLAYGAFAIGAANYAKVPMRRPRFGARGIWERDGGVCQ